jgi:hypothetical protein
MDEQVFYRQQSPFTDPGDLADLLTDLPTDVPALSEIVRAVVIHRDETDRVFGFELPQERRAEANARYVRSILGMLGSLDPRLPQDRFAGTCRDFAILLCAMLRRGGVPARLRCGFAEYFAPGFFADHWVVEYWVDGPGWRLADAQIPASMQEAYPTPFHHADVPRDRFLVAGQAWLDCRRGERDPGTFGVAGTDLRGLAEIQCNVVKDLAALNRIESLPWDDWGLSGKSELTEPEWVLLDQAARLSANGGPLEQLVAFYQDNPVLQAPERTLSA